MNRRSFPLFLAVFFLCFSLSAAAPKLIVVVVVDQMRADYFDRFPEQFNDGLRTLLKQSAFYGDAFYEHIPTETAPGHATLITGAPPSVHGIIGNDWYDRINRRITLSIGAVNSEGNARLLMAPTLGDHLKKISPQSKVISVSLKDRSAILMGGQHPDLVLWFDKKKREFKNSDLYPKDNLAWLDDFNKNDASLDDPRKSWTALGIDYFLSSPLADQALQSLVEKIFQKIPLGKSKQTDLLCISYSGTDYCGHRFGPDSSEMKNQLLQLDRLLGILIRRIDTESNHEFVLALTADHGVFPIPESPTGRDQKGQRVLEDDLKKDIERMATHLFPNEKNPIASFQFPHLYLNPSIETTAHFKNKKRDFEKALLSIKNVAAVYAPDTWDQDRWGGIYQRSFFPGRSGDFTIRMKSGVIVAQRFQGTTHGSPYAYDSHVPLLIYSPHQAAKIITDKVSIEQLEPTLASFFDPHQDSTKMLPGITAK